MSELFGIVAAGVGVADVACRLAKGLYGFTSDLKNASAELRRLQRKLRQLSTILRQTAFLGEEYRNSAFLKRNQPTFDNIGEILEVCVSDLRKLQRSR